MEIALEEEEAREERLARKNGIEGTEHPGDGLLEELVVSVGLEMDGVGANLCVDDLEEHLGEGVELVAAEVPDASLAKHGEKEVLRILHVDGLAVAIERTQEDCGSGEDSGGEVDARSSDGDAIASFRLSFECSFGGGLAYRGDGEVATVGEVGMGAELVYGVGARPDEAVGAAVHAEAATDAGAGLGYSDVDARGVDGEAGLAEGDSG